MSSFSRIKKTIMSKQFLTCIITTFVIGLIAHGYCFFNLLYSHDSLLVVQNDTSFQISLGRFLIPVFVAIRGAIYAPAFVGFLSLIFLSFSVFLVCKLFSFNNTFSIILVSCLMVVNCVVTLTNATFIHNSDMYMFTLLCAVLGVYFLTLRNKKSLFSVLCFFICLGIYQSYLQVSSVLIVLLSIIATLNKTEIKESFSFLLKGVVCILISLILYLIAEKGIMSLNNIQASATYNSLSSMGFSSVAKILSALFMTYKYVLGFFIKPITAHSSFVMVLNFILIVCAIWFLISLLIHKKVSIISVIYVLFLQIILPFTMNFCCFLANGEEHSLMKYSFIFSYVFVLYLLKLYVREALWKKDIFNVSVSIIIIIQVFCSFIYSNQVYLYKHLNSQSTLSLVTRIVDRIEQTDGYKSGITPVAICGNAENLVSNSNLSLSFDTSSVGLESQLSTTYYDTYYYYLKYVLNSPIQLVGKDVSSTLSESPEVKQMHSFPSRECTKIINNILVIKLS